MPGACDAVAQKHPPYPWIERSHLLGHVWEDGLGARSMSFDVQSDAVVILLLAMRSRG